MVETDMTVGPAAGGDVARRDAALAAEAPEGVMESLRQAFADLLTLTKAGDRQAAAGAALAVQDRALLLCVDLAASGPMAKAKRGVLAVVVRWLWARAPSVAAVLEVARAQERTRWGGDADGTA